MILTLEIQVHFRHLNAIVKGSELVANTADRVGARKLLRRLP